MLICRVAKNLPVLELLNHFVKSSTVSYKRGAYQKNLVYAKKYIYPAYVSKHKSNREKQVFFFFLMIPNGEGCKAKSEGQWHYLAVKKLSAI